MMMVCPDCHRETGHVWRSFHRSGRLALTSALSPCVYGDLPTLPRALRNPATYIFLF